MKIKIEQHKPHYDVNRSALCDAPEWWVSLPSDTRGVDVMKRDRVDNTGSGDVFEVTWWGLVD